MAKGVRKNWYYIIFLYCLQGGCIYKSSESDKAEVVYVMISTDIITNLSRVDSVMIKLKYSNSTSIYGVKLFWDTTYIPTMQTSINNYSWSDMVSISFKSLDQFVLEEKKEFETIKEEIKNKLHIELNDFGKNQSIDVFLKDTSKILIHYYAMTE